MNDKERVSTDKSVGHCHTGMGHCHKGFKSLSWTGVIAGALVATGLSFLFNLFDIGIGLSVVKNTREGVMTVVVGGLIGMLIGAVVTMFVAGLVSGFLARSCSWNQHLGVLQGFTTWCLALLITLILFTSNVSHLTFSSHLLAEHLSAKPTVSVTTNENTPAVSAIRDGRAQVIVNAEKSANNMGKGALITFLIFFIGAVSCCFGGFIGVCCEGSMCHTNEFDRKKSP